MLRRVLVFLVFGIALAGRAPAQQNRIDTVTPSAPELAGYGKYAIGARTLQVTDKNRPDILSTKEGGATARYDRTLTLEIWYPSALAAGQKPGGDYRAVTRDPAITATLHGQAVRDAAPLPTDGPFPLVVISHGYPGNRYLMSHLGENLASKASSSRRSITRTAPTTIRKRSAARSTTARSISCSCSTRWIA